MRKSDFAIGLIVPDAPNDSVYYEIGAASALGKRSLLVLDPGLKELPPEVAGLAQVRAKATDTETIRFALDQMLSKPTPEVAVQRVATNRTKPIGDRADTFIARLGRLGQGPEQELVALIVEALGASGIEVYATPPNRDAEVDLALWADELSASVGNPLIVEVKSNLGTPERLRDAQRQLETYLSATNAQWGLLLYVRGPPEGAVPGLIRSQAVLSMSVRELLESLRSRSFGDVIRGARNQLVHGARSS